MTRASVAIAAIALAWIGCHEEPTIVIKFEPNDLTVTSARAAATPTNTEPPDLSVRPSDMAQPRAPSDLGARSKTKPPKAAKAAGSECKVASDCVVEPIDCCDCANGGKQHAIARKNAAASQAARAARCKHVMCTMMFSTDPTCGQRADCVDGTCMLVRK